MKTFTRVLNEAREFEQPIIRAVYRRLGSDNVQAVYTRGIETGFPGFFYYPDTSKFFRKYRSAICQMAENLAYGRGEDMLTMIKSWGCLEGRLSDDFSETDIGQVIFGKWDNLDNIKFPMISNAMVWFAAGEICRRFEG